MKKLLALMAGALVFASVSGSAQEIIKIEVGKDYRNYSQADLQRRVWELERAVWQLQQRVFQLESDTKPTADSWVCTMKAMGNVYTGTGGTQAVAKSRAIENCKSGQGGDGFFCKQIECSQ